MKTTSRFLGAILLTLSICKQGFSQSDVAGLGGHVRVAGYYVGWNATGVAGSLDVRNDFNQPINFFTNAFQRVIMNNGGGGNAGGRVAMGNDLPAGFTPTARLHLHQTLGPTVTMRFSHTTTGSTNNDGYETGIDSTGEVFYINNEPNRNFSWYNQGNFGAGLLGRMRLYDGGTAFNTGFLALSNNLPFVFVPRDRVHIYQNSANRNFIRFSNTNTGITANDGSQYGIQANGASAFRNLDEMSMFFETSNVDNTGNSYNRLQIFKNGQTYLGTPGLTNVQNTDSTAVANFSQVPTSLLNVRGPINSCAQLGAGSGAATIIYGYTPPRGTTANATNDGFRMKFDWDGKGANNDAWIFEKTDGQQPDPDGCIVFENTGQDSVPEVSMKIQGNGFVGIGQTFTGTLNPNFNVRRRLEVLENHKDTLAEPQFRLTFRQSNPPGGAATDIGFNTDFQSTPLGDLAILPGVDSTLLFGNTPVLLGRRQRNVGINTTTPGNTLEINSAFAGPTSVNNQPPATGFGPATGWAGLRFSDLRNGGTNSSIPQLNPGPAVLSVDSSGDVILVPSGGAGAGGGNPCGATPLNPLLSSWEIPLNNYTYVFSDPTPSTAFGTNRVGIGSTCLPGSKLEVIQNLTNNTVPLVQATTSINNDIATAPITGTAMAGAFLSTANNRNNIGAYGEARNAATNTGGRFVSQQNFVSNSMNNANIGVSGTGNNASRCAGVVGSAVNTLTIAGSSSTGGDFTASGSVINFGVRAQATIGVGNTNFGVSAQASGNATSTNYGVYAQVFPNPGNTNYAVYGDNPTLNATNWAGFFNGQVFSSGGYLPSDGNFKSDTGTIINALGVINDLKPMHFRYDTILTDSLGLAVTGDEQFGFIAQDVESVLPTAVKNITFPAKTDTAGNIVQPSFTFKGVNHTNILPFAVKAIQEISHAPNAPTLLSPTNNASGDYQQVTLTWNSVSTGLVFYHVQISKDSTFSIISSESDQKDTTLSLSLDSAQWYWRVKAINNFGSSAWSQTFTFTNTVNKKDGGTRDFPQSTLSDLSLKQNVNTLTGSLDKVKQLRGVEYKWNTNGLALMNGDTSKQIGMIAQEVKNVVSEVVYEEDSILHVDYQHLAPVFVEAIKELAKKDSLKNIKMNNMQAQLDSLKMVMAACCSNQNTRINQNVTFTEVELSDKNIIVLNQNVPNPFAEQTTISYNIPNDFSFAQIMFYDLNGRMIKAVDIKQKGRGQLNVYANDLSNGIYSYTLIVDNKIIDTKKMVKQD